MIPSRRTTRSDRFLIALLNRAPEWLLERKGFCKMLPREPRQFASEPSLTGKELTIRRVSYWQGQLREAWTKESAGQRQMAMTQAIAIYGAMAFSTGPDLRSRAEDFGKALTRMAKRGTTQTGLRPDAFLHVLHRAREISRQMRRCVNPACKHPFFIASRRSDKNCSRECGRLGKNAANLKWWRRCGKEWRAKQRKRSRKRGN